MKENDDEMDNIIKYIDSMVTTINPGINATIPTHHPCQKRSDEIENDEQDYIELINKLQRQTVVVPHIAFVSTEEQVNKYVDLGTQRNLTTVLIYAKIRTDSRNLLQRETIQTLTHTTVCNCKVGTLTWI